MSAEPDQAPDTVHPRENFAFVGHGDAEAALAAALSGGRMHHAWLLTGPRRLGKATLAYRFARAALGANPIGPRPLDVDPNHPAARKIAQRAHPDLFLLRRGLNERTGKPRSEITVEDARALGQFFSMAPAEGGMRVAIIDAVDELNRNAANAILKTLEEPPPRAVLILVCHAPGAALATIRSRCRKLALRPLSDAQVAEASGGASDALIRLAKGRPGLAIALKAQGGEDMAKGLADALAALPSKGASAVLPVLIERAGGEDRLALTLEIVGDWVRARALSDEKGSHWANAWSALEELRQEADGLDMDSGHALARAAGVLDRAALGRS
ncbi:MAG: DNA polymerase III subunit delta' [Caulobacterales bacterium]